MSLGVHIARNSEKNPPNMIVPALKYAKQQKTIYVRMLYYNNRIYTPAVDLIQSRK